MLLSAVHKRGLHFILSNVSRQTLLNKSNSVIGTIAAHSTVSQLDDVWRFENVPVGSELSLDLRAFNGPITVNIEVGHPETLELGCHVADANGSRLPHTVHDIIQLQEKQLQAIKGHQYTQYNATFASQAVSLLNESNELATKTAVAVNAKVPAKFFNLKVDINRGAVNVGSISDANHINISTAGGDVTLNKSKAAIVTVITCGGSIQGSTSGEFVLLSSGDAPNVAQSDVSTTPQQRGGDIRLHNVVGNEVFISTQVMSGSSGEVDINALYAYNSAIVGGNVKLGTVFCSKTAQIGNSKCSNITIGGVDGNLHVQSGGDGGMCKVFLNSNAKDIVLDLNGSNAEVSIGEKDGCDMLLINCNSISLPEGARQQPTEDSVAVVIEPATGSFYSPESPPSRLYRGEEGEVDRARVVVNASGPAEGNGGSVTVRRSSWLEQAMMKRNS